MNDDEQFIPWSELEEIPPISPDDPDAVIIAYCADGVTPIVVPSRYA